MERQKYLVMQILRDYNFDLSTESFREISRKYPEMSYAQALNNGIKQLMTSGHIRRIGKKKYQLLNDNFCKQNEFAYMKSEIDRLRIIEEKYLRIKDFISNI